MSAPKAGGRRVVITCRGISEPYGKNMLWMATKDLDPSKFLVIELVWSATFGAVPTWNGTSFGASVRTAEESLVKLLIQYPGAIVIGYSGGAQVAGNVARAIADGRYGVSIRAVGLLSDPGRDARQIIGENRGTQGIMGPRYINGNGRFDVWQLSAPGDPISDLPIGNGLAELAPVIEFWSIIDPMAWMNDLRGKALAGRFRFWERKIDWVGAHKWSLGYTRDGRHSCYHREIMPGKNVTYTTYLGQLIAGAA